MKILTTLLLLSIAVTHAQYSISGVVTDQRSNAPIAFATVKVENKTVLLTDINGRFSVAADGIEHLHISYAGYRPKHLKINPTNFINIKLTADTTNQRVAADAIMRRVIQNKRTNDVVEGRTTFSLKSYNKLLITANPDSVEGTIDTIYFNRARKGALYKIDSSEYVFKKIIEKQHLFQTEKASILHSRQGKTHEQIIATKMGGFQQPVYEVYGFQLFPLSVYSDPLVILETPYNSPLTNDALKHYQFSVLDTIPTNGRLTYVIKFDPKKRKKQSALQGILLVDVENFAIANAVITTSGIINIVGEHQSSYNAEQRKYFPTKSSLKVVKGNNEEDIKIFGETLKVAASPTVGTAGNHASDHTYLLSESTYFDYNFNDTANYDSAVAINIPEDALRKPIEFWQQYRTSDLTSRDNTTYKVLDSLAEKRGVENKLFIGRKIINGFLPLSFFDIELRNLISFNNYEGFRVGFGGQTNVKFSKKYRINGYAAYGTKDGNFKFQLGNAVRLNQYSDTWLGITYTDDIREIASTNFTIDKRSFKIYDPRPINISTFYNYVSWKVQLDSQLLPGTASTWQFSHELVRPMFDYYFILNDEIYRNFSLAIAVASVQWNPFSDYMQTPNGRIETVKRFPKFTVQITKAFPNVLGNELEFEKVEVRADYEKKFINRQKINLLLEAGYAHGQLPITHAYNTSPNNLNKDNVVSRITFAGKDSFETMFFNEFFSDRFVFSQFKYALDRLKISKQIKPTPVFVTRMVWGDMSNIDRHNGISFKTLDHGFYESGIELNGIFKGLGVSAFYRHGANHLPKLEDNFAVKLSFVFSIGI